MYIEDVQIAFWFSLFLVLQLSSIFIVSLIYFSLKNMKMSQSLTSHSLGLSHSTDEFPNSIRETAQRPVIPVRRKPVVMDDARAYQIEQKELESRKRV